MPLTMITADAKSALEAIRAWPRQAELLSQQQRTALVELKQHGMVWCYAGIWNTTATAEAAFLQASDERALALKHDR